MAIAPYRTRIQWATLPACFRTSLAKPPFRRLHLIVPLSKTWLVWIHCTLIIHINLTWYPCIIRRARNIPKIPRPEGLDRAGFYKATDFQEPSGLALLIVLLGRRGITYLRPRVMKAKLSRGRWQERWLALKLFTRRFQHQPQKPQIVNGMIQQSMAVIYRQGFQSRARYWYSAAFSEAVLL